MRSQIIRSLLNSSNTVVAGTKYGSTKQTEKDWIQRKQVEMWCVLRKKNTGNEYGNKNREPKPELEKKTIHNEQKPKYNIKKSVCWLCLENIVKSVSGLEANDETHIKLSDVACNCVFTQQISTPKYINAHTHTHSHMSRFPNKYQLLIELILIWVKEISGLHRSYYNKNPLSVRNCIDVSKHNLRRLFS